MSVRLKETLTGPQGLSGSFLNRPFSRGTFLGREIPEFAQRVFEHARVLVEAENVAVGLGHVIDGPIELGKGENQLFSIGFNTRAFNDRPARRIEFSNISETDVWCLTNLLTGRADLKLDLEKLTVGALVSLNIGTVLADARESRRSFLKIAGSVVGVLAGVAGVAGCGIQARAEEEKEPSPEITAILTAAKAALKEEEGAGETATPAVTVVNPAGKATVTATIAKSPEGKITIATTSTPTRTPRPTDTSFPTETPTPTMTITLIPTATPVPTAAEVLPGVTQPDSYLLQSAIESYSRTMGVNPEGAAISYQGLTDYQGNSFVVAINTIPEGQSLPGDYPLLIAEKNGQGEWEWREASRGRLGSKKEALIGAYVISWMAMQDNEYRKVLCDDTNHFQIDDLGIWSVLEPKQGEINQKELNKLLWAANLAERQGYTISVGSGMIWGHPDWGVPTWLKNSNYSQEDLLAIAENHIETFLGPFRNRLQRVSVANEMLPHLLGIPNFWTERVDRNILLKRAFRKTGQVVPNAELALRDFSVEFAGYPRAEEFYNLVIRLNAEEMAENGKRLINAVEFQLPLLLDALIGKDPAMDPSNFTNPENRRQMMEKLRNNIRRFRQNGVNVYIVELMLPIDNLPGVSIEEKLIHQAEIYADIYQLAIEENIGIGLTRTNYSRGRYDAYPDPNTNHLPYPRNERYEPLPSYYAINRVILSTGRIV